MEDREELGKWKEEFLDSGKYVIVEGGKDKKALVKMGMNPNLIIVFDRGIVDFCEDVAKITTEVVIMTDFDEEGKKLYGNFVGNFERMGVRVDRYFREKLRKNSHLSHIEGIDTYMQNLGL